jgi:DNA topoisomerase-1
VYKLGTCTLPSRYVVIIAEKPKAGRRIAEALGGRATRHCRAWGIPYWLFRLNGTYYVVAPSAGHLFGLTTSEYGFPVFSYEWAPLWQIDESAHYTKKFYALMSVIFRGAFLAINACDYDIEGSVIGYMIIKSFFDVRRARRMKFSALTTIDIQRAFRRLEPLDWNMVEAGLARHELDWLWGINVSRALMEALRVVTGQKVVLSAGRVQSPTLIEAVRRDLERRLHVPLPSFVVEAKLWFQGRTWRVRVFTHTVRAKAYEVARRLKSLGYMVASLVERKSVQLPPPPPFNLGDLQSEAARIYGLSPMKTQDVAEQLYLEALISYPRTNSQKIPLTIDVTSILKGLARLPEYRSLVARILATTRNPRPRQGLKDDPAHPAIHPTGNLPERPLSRDEARIYDLVVRRFLASMMPAARVTTVSITLTAPGLPVQGRISGVVIEDPGWFDAYPYSRPRESYLPPIPTGARMKVVEVYVLTEYTKPPDPYTKASLVKWMEAQGIGTESTRARIVELLFDRNYLRLRGKYVEATDLGYTVAELLAKYFPQLTSVELTRYFEEKLEGIRRGLHARAQVVNEAKKVLSKLLEDFKSNHIREAGLELAQSLGMVPARSRCKICDRAEQSNGLCRFHLEAVRRLKRFYSEWRKRMGVSFHEYLSILVQRSEAGSWIKEAAKYLLKIGQSYTNVA